jgi:hypothetical protein
MRKVQTDMLCLLRETLNQIKEGAQEKPTNQQKEPEQQTQQEKESNQQQNNETRQNQRNPDNINMFFQGTNDIPTNKYSYAKHGPIADFAKGLGVEEIKEAGGPTYYREWLRTLAGAIEMTDLAFEHWRACIEPLFKATKLKLWFKQNKEKFKTQEDFVTIYQDKFDCRQKSATAALTEANNCQQAADEDISSYYARIKEILTTCTEPHKDKTIREVLWDTLTPDWKKICNSPEHMNAFEDETVMLKQWKKHEEYLISAIAYSLDGRDQGYTLKKYNRKLPGNEHYLMTAINQRKELKGERACPAVEPILAELLGQRGRPKPTINVIQEDQQSPPQRQNGQDNNRYQQRDNRQEPQPKELMLVRKIEIKYPEAEELMEEVYQHATDTHPRLVKTIDKEGREKIICIDCVELPGDNRRCPRCYVLQRKFRIDQEIYNARFGKPENGQNKNRPSGDNNKDRGGQQGQYSKPPPNSNYKGNRYDPNYYDKRNGRDRQQTQQEYQQRQQYRHTETPNKQNQQSAKDAYTGTPNTIMNSAIQDARNPKPRNQEN